MAALHRPIYLSRVRELVRYISPHLKEEDQVLDIGCGSGMLGKMFLDSPSCPFNVKGQGLSGSNGVMNRLRCNSMTV